jgi:DNA polymerase
LRGRDFDFQGIPVRVTFHPSALLRDTGLKRPAWEDLKQFRTLMESGVTKQRSAGRATQFSRPEN